MELCNDGRRTNGRHRYYARNFGTRGQGQNHRIVWVNRSNPIMIAKSFYPFSGLGCETVDTHECDTLKNPIEMSCKNSFLNLCA